MKENKEKYVLEITRYEGDEKVEELMWGNDTLDELIADMDKKVERMRPITVSVNTKKMFERNLKDLQKEIIVEQNTVTKKDLQDLIISKYYQKITQDQLITESDVEILKHIF